MKNNKEKLLSDIKKDSFQTSIYLEEKLQPLIHVSKLKNLDVKELDDIRNQVKAERRFLEEINQELNKKKQATAKRDKFQEKFTYQNLKVK